MNTFDQIMAMSDGELMRQETDMWQAVARACDQHLSDLAKCYRPLVPGRPPEPIPAKAKGRAKGPK